MQDLIDAELTAAIGAGHHERTETHTNQRNGARTRLWSTPAGDLELRIPKVGVGTFFPSLPAVTIDGTGKCAESTLATPKTRSSGPPSCAASKTVACRGATGDL